MPIHPTAIVSPKAEIDSSADIGPHAIIEAPARIGPNVQIMANAVVGPWTEIGANSRIHFGAVIGHEPQHLAYKGEERWTCIGERTEIREYATIHRAFVEGGATRIGNDVLLMGLSHVGHDCKVGDRVILANGSLLAGHCEIGNGVVISGLSCTHQFVRVGRLAMIGGGSGARKDVPPFMTVSGVSTIRGLNVVGMRRAGFDPDVRQAIRAAYKTLYRKGLPVTAALNEIKSGEMIPEVREMVEFIEASKRGICRHYRRGSGESDD